MVCSYASRDMHKAEEFKRRYQGVAAYGSYDAAINSDQIDAVVIAVPPKYHLDLTLQALAAGKHVVLEKPALLSMADYETVLAARNAAGKVIIVGENDHYKPLAVCLRGLLAKDVVGDMLFGHFTTLALLPKKADDWRNDESMAGGDAFFEEGIHWLHVAGSLGPRITTIHGFRPPASTYAASTMSSPPLYVVHGVPCLWYPFPRNKAIILYLHANAVDLGMIANTMSQMRWATQCSVLAVEYPGYGVHQGSPSPDACVTAAMRAYAYVRERAPAVPVVIMGRSIGTGVAAQLAARVVARGHPCAGLVLISPFASMERMVAARIGGTGARLVAGGVLDTRTAVAGVPFPTLVLHGDADTLIPVGHGREVHRESRAQRKHLHVLRGCDHNALNWTEICAEVKRFLRLH